MPSQSIFRTELNALVKSLLNSGLDETGFEFSKDFSNKVFDLQLPLQITHKDSGFYFIVDWERDSFGSTSFTMSSFPSMTRDDDIEYVNIWDAVISSLESWLERVRTEVSQPDPWLLLNQGTILKDSIPVSGASEKFNEMELFKIHEYLQSIRQLLISDTNPSQGQLELIDERLSYLEDSATRQSKQDWAHTAVGVMFTVAIGLAMAPDQANKLLQLTASFIKTIFVPLLK
jgi:hypothetical protein